MVEAAARAVAEELVEAERAADAVEQAAELVEPVAEAVEVRAAEQEEAARAAVVEREAELAVAEVRERGRL